MSQIPTVASILSASSSLPVSPMPSVTLADYPDISGEFLTQPVSRTMSVATQVRPAEADPDAEAEAQREPETESETVESEEEKPPVEPPAEPPVPNDEFDGAVGMATILVFGGMLIAGVAYFLNQPPLIEHPHSMRDYF